MDTTDNVLHIVHCIDTEGPLTESLAATFKRIESTFGVVLPANNTTLIQLQNRQLNLGGIEEAVSQMIAPNLLAYNTNWEKIRYMLDELLSYEYRSIMRDDFGSGWVYSWHCMDHMYYPNNPRHKDVGYGNIFRYYRSILEETSSTQDELNWHFHPMSITGNPLHAATSYCNSYPVLIEVICRRILEDNWFPVINRPGFHSERPDSHAFLEQWMPFDFANQVCETNDNQPDLIDGRFGDWRRASVSWRGYHPDHDDYQSPGSCKRMIFRCLNVGTRLRSLNVNHIREAFLEAREHGKAILSFADHDYRDIRPDIEVVRAMIMAVKKEFPDVFVKFSGAEAAARDLLNRSHEPGPKLSLVLIENRLVIEVKKGAIFGSQPFLALKTHDGCVFHDNVDVQVPGCKWTYTLDDQTLPISALAAIGVGTAGRYGGYDVVRLELN